MDRRAAESPDLGPAFAFQERGSGACAAITRIHCFNHAASLSHGKLSGDIPAISGAPGGSRAGSRAGCSTRTEIATTTRSSRTQTPNCKATNGATPTHERAFIDHIDDEGNPKR